MIETVECHQAKEMIDANQVTVLDVRDPLSYQHAHIAGSINLSDDNIEEFLRTADRERQVLCCCFVGLSSQQAAEFLLQKGFKRVYNLSGGMEEWKRHYPCQGVSNEA